MVFWVLVICYWLHLLATVVWLGGLALMAFIAWPAMRQGVLVANHWLALQQRFTLWANSSLVILLITGFIQMTNDPNYQGFLAVDSLWAWAILVKHIAFGGMIGIAAYLQMFLYPAMGRVRLLLEQKPQLAADEQIKLQQQEVRYLRLNLICATVVLFCTAVATAV